MPSTQNAARPSLDEVWLQVSTRLHAYLRKRGLSLADAEDIVQTVAERVLRHDIEFGDADELLHWCLTVARNLDVDRQRALSRRGEAASDALANVGERGSLEDRVLHRLRLERTTELLARMRQTDRDAIVQGVSRAEPASGRERVALYRARLRLLEAVGPMSVLVVCGRRVLRVMARPATVPTSLAAAVLITGIVAITDQGTTLPPRSAHSAVLVPAELTRALVAGAGPKTTASPPAGPSAARLTPRQAAILEHTFVTFPGGVAAVAGHDRRPQDSGLVCLRHLPVDIPCIGPTTMPGALP